ncbi:hypothetical protein C7S10_11880 [Nocardioides currus]|uniref:Aldehyde dehydrogenase domain-containing protein n=1 Tax=Nocardioides currus TaxID=2133958 RepID=A0A2R7YXG3_9ACTN|nr:hypothetical protein C7S10_11880 [Nocardioides currus]
MIPQTPSGGPSGSHHPAGSPAYRTHAAGRGRGPLGLRRESIGACTGTVPLNFSRMLASPGVGRPPVAGRRQHFVARVRREHPTHPTGVCGSAEEAGVATRRTQRRGAWRDRGRRPAQPPHGPKFACTGSAEVRKKVNVAASDNLKRGSPWERRGNGPNNVLGNANLDIPLDGSLSAFPSFAGRVSDSMRRLLVQAHLHEETVEQLVARIDHIHIGDPEHPPATLAWSPRWSRRSGHALPSSQPGDHTRFRAPRPRAGPALPDPAQAPRYPSASHSLTRDDGPNRTEVTQGTRPHQSRPARPRGLNHDRPGADGRFRRDVPR